VTAELKNAAVHSTDITVSFGGVDFFSPPASDLVSPAEAQQGGNSGHFRPRLFTYLYTLSGEFGEYFAESGDERFDSFTKPLVCRARFLGQLL
jgi:hypothetical protein